MHVEWIDQRVKKKRSEAVNANLRAFSFPQLQ
jgi:hypothetical protein